MFYKNIVNCIIWCMKNVHLNPNSLGCCSNNEKKYRQQINIVMWLVAVQRKKN